MIDGGLAKYDVVVLDAGPASRGSSFIKRADAALLVAAAMALTRANNATSSASILG